MVRLARGHFFKGPQNYMENKNENKTDLDILIVLWIAGMVEIEQKDGGNRTHRLYIYHSNYVISKLIMDNGLDDLWRMEDPDSSEFTHSSELTH